VEESGVNHHTNKPKTNKNKLLIVFVFGVSANTALKLFISNTALQTLYA
jgi:hypothetical protein